MPDHVTLTAALPLKEPADAAVRAALVALVQAVRQEPGCLEYNAHIHAEDARRVLFYERWQDKAALDVHARAKALADFRALMGERVAGPSELTFWQRLA